MSVQYPLVEALAPEALRPRPTVGGHVAKFVRTKPLGAAGAAVTRTIVNAARRPSRNSLVTMGPV